MDLIRDNQKIDKMLICDGIEFYDFYSEEQKDRIREIFVSAYAIYTTLSNKQEIINNPILYEIIKCVINILADNNINNFYFPHIEWDNNEFSIVDNLTKDNIYDEQGRLNIF